MKRTTPLKSASTENDKVESTGKGRPSKYLELRENPQFLQEVHAKLVSGYTHKQIAEDYGVSYHTVDSWLTKYPEFSEVVKSADKEKTHNVAVSFYKACIGYEYEDIIHYFDHEYEYDVDNHMVAIRNIPKEKRVIKRMHGRPDLALKYLNYQDPKWRFIAPSQTNGNLNLHFGDNKLEVNFSDDELKVLDKLRMNEMISKQNKEIESMPDNE